MVTAGVVAGASALLVIVALGGCGGGAGEGGGSAAAVGFLSELHNAAPDIASARTDTQLVRLGHAACDGFAAGASYEELADRLALEQGAHQLPSGDLGAVITSAADNFCPKYRDKVS